ncbi:YcaO-like family protein [Pseudomonas sp. B22129]|uniref:YcaO-like family protein n=1 Tax=Pseudomonas sp. B22129 TaxID=3235111 RepID=UPI0037841674
MNKNNSYSNKTGGTIPLPPDYPSTVPLASCRVVQLSPDLFFATQELSEDPNCPNGVFSTSVAVDRSAHAALTRARYEAAERFAVAAILDGHKFSTFLSIDPTEVFEYPVKLVPPLTAMGRSANTLFLELSEVYNMPSKYVAAADVFAPYPIVKGECSWHPTTNGVAVGSSYESAKLASFLEYLERHSIMQYWYEGRASYFVEQLEIHDMAGPETDFLNGLGYDLTCLEISALNSIYVILLFAKSRSREYPFLVCSAGTARSLQSAVRKAAQETVQTLVACTGQTEQFLYWKGKGETVNSLDHRMYFFADPTKADLIEQVILDATTEAIKFSDRPPEGAASIFQELQDTGLGAGFVDITPRSWVNSLHCVRCYSSTMIPLLVSEMMVQKASRLSTASRFVLPHPFP